MLNLLDILFLQRDEDSSIYAKSSVCPCLLLYLKYSANMWGLYKDDIPALH